MYKEQYSEIFFVNFDVLKNDLLFGVIWRSHEKVPTKALKVTEIKSFSSVISNLLKETNFACIKPD